MPDRLSDRINAWISDTDVDSSEILTSYQQLEFLADELYDTYLPTQDPVWPKFRDRLCNWLDQVGNNDQLTLFSLVLHVFFVKEDHLRALSRAAYRGPVFHWLVEQAGLQFDDANLQVRLADEIRRTWFCGITDSMDTRAFQITNNITVLGQGLRPNWQDLNSLGNLSSVETYMTDNGLTRLVLLEDFVGSGSQMRTALEAHSQLNSDVPLLLAPLIACPAASQYARSVAVANPSVSYSPVLELPEHTFLKPDEHADEPRAFASLRDLLIRLASQVQGDNGNHWYGPFGFPMDAPTGGLVVLYSNCPDNTLPAVHYQSTSWRPLFPRNSRLP